MDIANAGVACDTFFMRIRRQARHTVFLTRRSSGLDKSSGSPVFIDANGQLGTGALATGPTDETAPAVHTQSARVNRINRTNGNKTATGPTGPTSIAGTNGTNGATGPTGATGIACAT